MASIVIFVLIGFKIGAPFFGIICYFIKFILAYHLVNTAPFPSCKPPFYSTDPCRFIIALVHFKITIHPTPNLKHAPRQRLPANSRSILQQPQYSGKIMALLHAQRPFTL